MDKQFIPYELALILKELGFDEECMGVYENSNKLNSIGFWLNQRMVEAYKYDCLALLWQQTFDWFRIEKNMYGEIIPMGTHWCIQIADLTNSLPKKEKQLDLGVSYFTGYPDLVYDSYEEAREALLKQIIEIYKQSNK